MKILFVCTGNSCRSPMAEALARKIFSEKNLECELTSSGVSVLLALPPSEHAIETLSSYGIDISEYKTKQITRNDVETSDLVLTMTKRHKEYLDLQIPALSDRVHILNTYVGLGDKDIEDPFGKSLEVYKNCAKELETAINALAEKIESIEKQQLTNSPILALGSDHGGFLLKQEIIEYLKQNKIEYKDFGTVNMDSTDYPIYAKKVTEAVISGECVKGILTCGTGIGISIAANKYKGIRAALCHDVFSAKASREHNDANILVMGGRVIGMGHALEIVKAFLETDFSNDQRHIKRICLIEQI